MAGPWEDYAKPAAGTTREANPWDEFKTKAPESPVAPGPWNQFKAATPPPSESGTLFGDAPAETVLGEIGAGLQSGVRQVISAAPAIAGLGAQLVDSLGVDTHGLPQALLETSSQIAEGGSQRGVARLEDLKAWDPVNWTKYVAGTLGEGVPFIASILSGAGGARLLANYMARKAIPASTRSSILRSIPAELVGAGTVATGIETGATAQELFRATGEVEPFASALAGTAKGALESVFPLMLGKAFGLTGMEAGHLLDRLLLNTSSRGGRALVGAATEGATESAQEEIDLITRNFMDEKFAYMGPEAWSRRMNAPVAGAVGGGFFASLTPHEAPQMLNDKFVRDAAGETPIVTGQTPTELATSDPADAIRRMPMGLSATASAATTMQLDQLLSEVDFRHRGLYAPVVPGLETTFGTQDQAQNDGVIFGGTGYLKLDPGRVKRGDVSASVEDLPTSIADSRVDFLDQTMMSAASKSLAEAIRLKNDAARAKSGGAMEAALQAASAMYRQAMNQGARVEPYADGQIVIRDPNKMKKLTQQVNSVDSQLSAAGLDNTRTLSNGAKFHVFTKGAEETDTGPKGRLLDLEKVRPESVTGLPTRDLVARVLADSGVSRRQSIGRARGMGIRFLNGTPIADQQRMLKEMTRIMQSMSGSLRFDKQPKEIVDRFMKLVQNGLRIDVKPGSDTFALLEQVGDNVLAPSKDIIGMSIGQDDEAQRIIRSRARRTRDPRVSKYVNFQNEAVAQLFLTQLHATGIQRALVGDMPGGWKTGQPYTLLQSELATVLRAVAKDIGLKTDYVIEIVAPATLPDQGVRYVEKSIVPPGGKVAQERSVIEVNPWYYAVPTLGQKPLTDPFTAFLWKGGPFVTLRKQSPAQKKKEIFLKDGTKTTIGAIIDQVKPNKNMFMVVNHGNDTGSIGTFDRFEFHDNFMKLNQKDIDDGKMVPTAGVTSKDLNLWLAGANIPPPAYKARTSVAGRTAQKLGTASTKMHVNDLDYAEFFADFAVAVSESIVTFEWGKTDAAVQEMIRNAWKREDHLVKGASVEQRLAVTVPHPILDRAIRNQGSNQAAYDFEHWLVNQIARYFTRPEKVIGPVAKWFQKTGGTIRRVIGQLFKLTKDKSSVYAMDPNFGQPNAVVERWLADLELRGIKNIDAPFLDKPTRDVLIDSINKNRAAFKDQGIDEYTVATPQRASTYQVRQLMALLPPKGHEEARAKLEALVASADRHNTMMEWLLGIHQMADMNPHIAGMQQYVSNTRAMENTALSWATLADTRLREAQKLGKAQTDALFGLIFDLDQMVYLTPKEIKDRAYRWPTPQELLDLTKKHKLNGDTFKVYVDMRADFLQFISYLEEVSVTNAMETISDPEHLAKRVLEIRGETSQIRQRPYFPHMRFGKYATTVRDKKGKVLHFEAFESKADRDKANVEIAKKFQVPQNNTITEDYLTDTLQQWQGLPRYALQNVIKQLGLDGEDLSAQQKKDRTLLEAMAEGALPTESFRRNLVNRKNVPGYSLDGMRAYATYFGRAARFMARLEYARSLELAIQDVRATASPISKDKRSRIADFMTRHYDAQMEPANDWAELRGLGFLWYFAFVPAAAFTNLTQVPLVTMPFLATKFGDLKTFGKVAAAYSQNTKEFYDWLKGNEVADTPKNEAIEEAHFNRLIDDGFATELAAISQGPVLQSTLAGNGVSRGLRRFAQWGTAPFALAERINRSVTFRSTFDLAMADNNNPWIDEVMAENDAEVGQLRIDRGWDERVLRSYMAAAEAVRRTQFEYGRWSRPQLMSGVKGVLFMFKTYLQNMLYFMFKTDRRTQVRYMLLMLGTAGIMGLPGAEDMMEIAKWLARQFGLQFDMEREIRRMMIDWGANDVIAPDVVMHGASRVGFGVPAAMSGLGIPAPTIDLSGSLSMGKLIPGLQKGLNPSSSMFNDTVGDVVSEVAGPVFGVPFAMYQAMTDFSTPADDPKRWEKVMPRSMKAMSRASRFLAEQRERDRTGATVYQFDPNDVSDQMDILLGVGLGFQPTALSQQWDYLTARKEVEDYWKAQRQVLMSEMYRATRLKDPEGRKSALDAIRKFNDEAPDRALKITGDSIRQSLQSRSKGKLLKEKGVPQEKSLRGVAKGVDALYPEVVRREKIPQQGKAP